MDKHPRCGTCVWTEPVPQDLSYVECFGAPPVPILMPAQTPDGQTGMVMQIIRPNVPRTTRGCSRHTPKPLETVANDVPSRVV